MAIRSSRQFNQAVDESVLIMREYMLEAGTKTADRTAEVMAQSTKFQDITGKLRKSIKGKARVVKSQVPKVKMSNRAGAKYGWFVQDDTGFMDEAIARRKGIAQEEFGAMKIGFSREMTKRVGGKGAIKKKFGGKSK